MKKVLVFIPPPVEPGEAPINMRIRIKKVVALVIIEILTVLKPAVLGVTAWKMDARIFSLMGIPLRTLFHSSKENNKAPVIIRVRDVRKTILKCRGILNLSFFNLATKNPKITLRGKNPIPPRKIKIITVRFTRASPLKEARLSEKREKPALQKAEIE